MIKLPGGRAGHCRAPNSTNRSYVDRYCLGLRLILSLAMGNERIQGSFYHYKSHAHRESSMRLGQRINAKLRNEVTSPTFLLCLAGSPFCRQLISAANSLDVEKPPQPDFRWMVFPLVHSVLDITSAPCLSTSPWVEPSLTSASVHDRIWRFWDNPRKAGHLLLGQLPCLMR